MANLIPVARKSFIQSCMKVKVKASYIREKKSNRKATRRLTARNNPCNTFETHYRKENTLSPPVTLIVNNGKRKK